MFLQSVSNSAYLASVLPAGGRVLAASFLLVTANDLKLKYFQHSLCTFRSPLHVVISTMTFVHVLHSNDVLIGKQ